MVIPYAGICAGGEPSRNAEARPYRDSSVVALQEGATNHPQAAAVKSRGGERCGTRRALSASGVTQ